MSSAPSWLFALAQREREHRDEALRDGTRREVREALVGAEVGNGDGLAGLVRGDARPFAELGLQLLEAQRRVVGRGRRSAGSFPAAISVTPAP